MVGKIELIYFICLICSLLLNGSCANENDELILSTNSGKIGGFLAESYSGRKYFAFRGIPYAKAPVGPLRFKPPLPLKPWNDVFDATKLGPECPQYNFIHKEITGVEDCLVLNVYTTQLPIESSELLPVMVFVHGGGFAIGSGSAAIYGPAKFMDQDVVLITINYRLGVFGFLNTEDSASHGNYGMLDQIMAFKWIQENVAKFGGDPNHVVIFGESAGGASVLYHLISPLSKGLFSGMIAQSGSPLNPWAFSPKPLHWAKKLAEGMDCPIDSTLDMVDCLRSKKYTELLEAQKSLIVRGLFPMIFTPSVESPGGSGFLVEEPLLLFKEKRIANKAPVILGLTSRESYAFIEDWKAVMKSHGKTYLDNEFAAQISKMLLLNPELSSAIAKQYFENIDVSDKGKFYDVLITFLSDYLFNANVIQTMNFLHEADIPIWSYLYSHPGNHSLAELFGGKPEKFTTHGDELFVQFAFFFTQSEKMTEDDKKMSDLINAIWTNFAKYGKPLISNGNEILWPLYSEDDPKYLDLKPLPEIKNEHFQGNLQFWMEEIPKMMERLHKKDEL